MKRILFVALAMIMVASCAPKNSRLISTSTDLNYKDMKPVAVTDLLADLEVSPNKISFFYMPTKSVNNGGPGNVVETAIREALISNDNADVLVGLETQTKYNANGEVESITVTGYPAKYVNFRSIDEAYILEIAKMYIDFGLNFNYNVGPHPVPNIIPDIRPDSTPGVEAKGPMQIIGKLGKRK